MGQPKAKWSRYEDSQQVWTAIVGPFYLDVDGETGDCEIAEWDAESASIGRTLWEHHTPPPCDVVDLMRLTEDELARRLHGAAETMDGKELVAKPEPRRQCGADGCDGHSHPDEACKVADCRLCKRDFAMCSLFEQICRGCLREAHEMQNAAQPLVRGLVDLFHTAAAELHRKSPPCFVCGAQPKLITDCEPGSEQIRIEYRCGHSDEQRVRGSREWAVALMAVGSSVTDVHGRDWLREDTGLWVITETGELRTFEQLPKLGWCLRPL